LILAKEKPLLLPEAAPAPLRKKATARRNRVAPRVAVIGAIVVGFAVLLSLTSMYATIGMTGYKIATLKQEINAMQTENKRLELKLYQLKSLDRIENIATTKLGMVQPEQFAYLVMDKPAGTSEAKVAETASGKKVADGKRHPLIQAVTDFLTSKEEGYSQAGAKI
jgi:cell division protein FtsL